MEITRTLVLALSLCLFVPTLRAASETESLASIEQSAIEHVRSRVHPTARVRLEPLDTRLRLPACDQPPSTKWSPGSGTTGRVTVQVSCESNARWRIHVQATVIQELSLWVLANDVRAGEILAESMLRQENVFMGDASSPRRLSGNPVTDPTPVMGFEFNRPARSGEPLDAGMLQPRKLVLKGETVLLKNSRPGLILQARGVSLTDAAIGERVQVRNVASDKVVDAVVTERGVVEALAAQ